MHTAEIGMERLNIRWLEHIVPWLTLVCNGIRFNILSHTSSRFMLRILNIVYIYIYIYTVYIYILYVLDIDMPSEFFRLMNLSQHDRETFHATYQPAMIQFAVRSETNELRPKTSNGSKVLRTLQRTFVGRKIHRFS